MLTNAVATKLGRAGLRTNCTRRRKRATHSPRTYWTDQKKAAEAEPPSKAQEFLTEEIKWPSLRDPDFWKSVGFAFKQTFFGDTTDMRAPNEPFVHYMFAKADRRLYWEMRTCPLPSKEEWEDFWEDNDYIAHQHWRPEQPIPFDMKRHLEQPGKVEDLRMFWYTVHRHPLVDMDWLREEDNYMKNLEEKIESAEMNKKFAEVLREVTADLDLPKKLTEEEIEFMASYEPTPEGKAERIKHIRDNEELVIMARALDEKVGKLNQIKDNTIVMSMLKKPPKGAVEAFDGLEPEEIMKDERFKNWSKSKKERQLFKWKAVKQSIEEYDEAAKEIKEAEEFLAKLDKALEPLQSFMAEYNHMSKRRMYKVDKLWRMVKTTGAADSICRSKISRLYDSLLSVHVLPEHRDLFLHEHDISMGEIAMEWLHPFPAPVETYEEMPIIKDFDEPEDWEDADEHAHH